MKKILLVSQYFSPCTLTPAQRLTYWAENFHRLGYYPVVVTRAWNEDIKTHTATKLPFGDGIRVEKFDSHEVHYLPFVPGILDRAYLNFGETSLRPLFLMVKILDVILAGFSLRFTSFANYLPYLKTLISEQKFEKMIISGEPFYLFRLGSSLNKRFGISWIADYRDDWSTNELQMEKAGGSIRKLIAKIESYYEKRWVGTASSILSVSESYTNRIARFLSKRGISVQNGFEEKLLELPETPLFADFTVMYSGVLYPSQNIRMILQVLEECVQQGKPFRLVFLGTGFDVKEQKRIESLVPPELKPWVEVTQRYPRAEAIHQLQRAHVLLGMAYGDMKGIPSSKLYEYLALGKPVFLCPSDGDTMEQILKETGLGFFATQSTEGKQVILNLMELYRTGPAIPELKERSRPLVKKYARYHQLEILANHLDG